MTSKKGPGKSLAAAFGAFSASAVEESQARGASAPLVQPRVMPPVLGVAKRSIQDLREERDRFEALAASGGGYRELSPDLIDPSPFSDRLPDDDDAGFERFKATVQEKGQKVPILVRLHPQAEGRFQVVYGHRRLRATRELGIPVKALVCEYSDEELAIAQGIENAERQDLSWIEQALFATHLSELKIKARDVRAALSVDDTELSRFRRALRVVPDDLIRVIGRAPKAGRTRWLLLVEAIETDPNALQRVRKAVADAKAGNSDERFAAALSGALRTKEAAPAAKVEPLRHGDAVIGQVAFSGKGVQFRVQPDHSAAFADFLRDEIPELMKRFAARSGAAAE